MMDIFIEHKLYPNEQSSVLKHYSSHFDSVFVGFIPFFKVPNYSIKQSYPDDELILNSGLPVSWNSIIENTEIKDFRELNKALMTSIGAYKKILEREDLLNILNRYTESQNIWDPTEGTFDVFTKKRIFTLLKANNLNTIVVEDEFYENSKLIDLTTITCEEFTDRIEFKDYYIYSENKEILFSIDWDYYFFFIAFHTRTIQKSAVESSFDGFWADNETSHLWTWEKGELESLLNK